MSRMLLGVVAALGVASAAHAGATDYFAEFAKDFGTSPRGAVLVHHFTVKNTSPNVVTIGTPRVSCGCVSADVLKATLAPGESTCVRAFMDTRRIPLAGTTKAVTVYVPFLAPQLEEVALRVQTVTRDDLMMSPDVLAFGVVRTGQPATATTKVTFYGDANWTVTEAVSNGVFVKAAAKVAAKVGHGTTIDVTATLDPKCPAGNWTAEVWLTSSTPGLGKIRVPVTVAVVTPIAVMPEELKFSDLKVGTSVDHKFILKGNQAFKVLEVKGTDDQVSVKQASAEAMPTHELTVTVKAKAAGELTRTLEIVTDHKDQKKLTLPFTATVAK